MLAKKRQKVAKDAVEPSESPQPVAAVHLGTMVQTSKGQRRLDSLARVLEGRDECAAVCIDKYGKLIVASNSIDETSTTTHKTYSTIDRTLKYFQKVARDEKIYKSRKTLLSDICMEAVKGTKNNPVDDVTKKLIRDILFDGEKLRKYKDIKTKVETFTPLYIERNYSEYNRPRVFEAVLAIHTVGRHFLKLEQGLKMTTAEIKSDIDFGENFLKLKETLSSTDATKGYTILKKGKVLKETEEGKEIKKIKHAEMKILDHLRKEETSPIEGAYIGISKLCCLDCHCVVEALNQRALDGWHLGETTTYVSGEHEDTPVSVEETAREISDGDKKVEEIKIRGATDMSFSKKWQDPDLLKDQEIRKVYEEKKKEITEKTHMDLYAIPSGSEPDLEDYKEHSDIPSEDSSQKRKKGRAADDWGQSRTSEEQEATLGEEERAKKQRKTVNEWDEELQAAGRGERGERGEGAQFDAWVEMSKRVAEKFNVGSAPPGGLRKKGKPKEKKKEEGGRKTGGLSFGSPI
jgi:hypothetical protein